MNWGFGRKAKLDPRETFWKWFLENEDMLLHFERDREKIFANLANQLRKINPDLCFEFGPAEDKREFVISAGGIKAAFPAVVSLSEAAPQLQRWRVTAFRPRRGMLHTIEFGGKHVDPAEVQFTLLQSTSGTEIGLNLFIPGLEEDDMALKQIGYLLLDEALGEYDVETRLGGISMLPPEATAEGRRHPLKELPVVFDALVARVEGRSAKPN